jgi:glycosyltransferase involved in cell wall biosynthesis
MYVFKNPEWIDKDLFHKKRLEDIPEDTFLAIRERLKGVMSSDPTITIVIAAWNEEVNIIRCLDSLSKNETTIPFDIVVVNNNSKDRTQEVINKLGVTSYFQEIQGCGPARELGQQKAKGKYILIADADCYYPKKWIERMGRELLKVGVICVYGRYSFLGNSSISRWQFSLYDIVRDIMVEIRHIKRPYLSAYGISMGYVKEYGIKEGYLRRNIRGDDGRLAFDLMKYGKVNLVRFKDSRVWTSNRTLERDGSLVKALKKRILREFARFDKYFTPPVPHDTKVSSNEEYTVNESIQIIKHKFNPFRLLKKKK